MGGSQASRHALNGCVLVCHVFVMGMFLPSREAADRRMDSKRVVAGWIFCFLRGHAPNRSEVLGSTYTYDC